MSAPNAWRLVIRRQLVLKEWYLDPIVINVSCLFSWLYGRRTSDILFYHCSALLTNSLTGQKAHSVKWGLQCFPGVSSIYGWHGWFRENGRNSRVEPNGLESLLISGIGVGISTSTLFNDWTKTVNRPWIQVSLGLQQFLYTTALMVHWSPKNLLARTKEKSL